MSLSVYPHFCLYQFFILLLKYGNLFKTGFIILPRLIAFLFYNIIFFHPWEISYYKHYTHVYRNRQLTEFRYFSSYGTCFIIIIITNTGEKGNYNNLLRSIRLHVKKKIMKEKKTEIPSREIFMERG